MIDRESVIDALEYLISEDCTDNQFDYADEIEAAITLLKEQEPRLLTYGDMYDKDFGYLQLKDDGGMYPVFLCGGGWDDENGMTFMKRSKKLVRLDGDWLNKNWRIWDKCPTPEEAEATPWQSL